MGSKPPRREIKKNKRSKTKTILKQRRQKNMVLKGKLIKCNRTTKTFKGQTGKEKLYITLAESELTNEQLADLKECFKDSGVKFTPDWVKDFEGYINLSTLYELPYKSKIDNTTGDSFEEYIANGFDWCGAMVQISVNLKDGAIYPKAILVETEGEPYNPFKDFED